MNEGTIPIRFIEGVAEDKRKVLREPEDKRKGTAIIAYACPHCSYVELFLGA
jgi:hypothetical protein